MILESLYLSIEEIRYLYFFSHAMLLFTYPDYTDHGPVLNLLSGEQLLCPGTSSRDSC